jgi:uncharacterized membrane protein
VNDVPAWILGIAAVVLVVLIVGALLRLIRRSSAGYVKLEWKIDRDTGDDD